MVKLLVSLAILCGLAAAIGAFDKEAAIADFMGKAEGCKGKTGANDGDVADLIGKKPAANHEGKCLRSCLMKEYEVMDGNGKMVKSVAMKHAEMFTEGAPDKMKIADEVVSTCSAADVSSDPCEAAEEYLKCFKEQALAHGIDNIDF
ncbi:general odorant-binding protein 28a-like [Haematobia irritans]|uniref:general odorant-binding protein 28a-like n=1 Tax=Haematobia irritans TaxID=7368 RepID=UPI003F4F99BA